MGTRFYVADLPLLIPLVSKEIQWRGDVGDIKAVLIGSSALTGDVGLRILIPL